MNVTQLFTQINSAYRGSDDNAPTTGDDFTLWLATANRKQQEWAKDTKQTWASLFKFSRPNEPGTVATAATTTLTGSSTNFLDYKVGDKVTVSGETVRTITAISSDTSLTVDTAFSGTNSGKTFTLTSIVTTSTRQYSLHRNFLYASDRLTLNRTTGPDYISLSKPQERDILTNEVFIANINPRMLHLRTDMVTATSVYIGASITLPGYYTPNDLVDGNSVVSVDDPYWLVYAVATELAFNDDSYENKTQQLNDKANNLYGQMVRLNRRGTYNNPRTVSYNVQRVLDPESEYQY